MTLADGTLYVGDYKHGLKHGQGKVVRADGSYIEGTFTEDLSNGSFKEFDAEGNFVRTVTFVNGMQR